jgi:hypothetical protein
MTRRGLELFLARFPDQDSPPQGWKLPAVRSGGVKVSLKKLKDLSREDEGLRSLGSK